MHHYDPTDMSIDDRLDEVASLLAAGFLRLKRRTGCLPQDALLAPDSEKEQPVPMGAADGFGDGAERPKATALVLEARFENANDDLPAFVIAAENIARLRKADVASRGLAFTLGRSIRTGTSRPGGQLAKRVEGLHQLPKPALSLVRKGFERRSKAFRLGATRFHDRYRGRTSPGDQAKNGHKCCGGPGVALFKWPRPRIPVLPDTWHFTRRMKDASPSIAGAANLG